MLMSKKTVGYLMFFYFVYFVCDGKLNYMVILKILILSHTLSTKIPATSTNISMGIQYIAITRYIAI